MGIKNRVKRGGKNMKKSKYFENNLNISNYTINFTVSFQNN